MIISVRGIDTAEGKLYSIIDVRPLEVQYSIKNTEDLVKLYNSHNKIITGFNYRVVHGDIVFRTSVGTGSSKSEINESLKNVQVTVQMNPKNVWTALSCLISNDSGYKVIVNGEPTTIQTIDTASSGNSIAINGYEFSEDSEIAFVMSNQAAIDETMRDLGPNNDFAVVRGNRIILRPNRMVLLQEYSQPRMKMLMSNIGPILLQLHAEYTKILGGFTSMYCAYTAQPDIEGNKDLVKFLTSDGIGVGNCMEQLLNSKEFDKQSKSLYLTGMREYLEYGNHSSLTYKMSEYFIYQYKVSEILLLQLAMCNCG